MNKKELIQAISKDTNLNLKNSKIALESVLSNIIKGSSEGDCKISFKSFGSFEKRINKPKICRNPSTGGTMKSRRES